MNNIGPWPADKSDWAGDAQMLGQSVCRFESLSTAPTAEKGEDLRIAKRWNVENAVSKGIRLTWDISCCGASGVLPGWVSHHTCHKLSWAASRASSCASWSSFRGIFWSKHDSVISVHASSLQKSLTISPFLSETLIFSSLKGQQLF